MRKIEIVLLQLKIKLQWFVLFFMPEPLNYNSQYARFYLKLVPEHDEALKAGLITPIESSVYTVMIESALEDLITKLSQKNSGRNYE